MLKKTLTVMKKNIPQEKPVKLDMTVDFDLLPEYVMGTTYLKIAHSYKINR